jgi:hypothetical protein
MFVIFLLYYTGVKFVFSNFGKKSGVRVFDNRVLMKMLGLRWRRK